ncbi:MAG: von Willebrand factor type A domain-containing protein [Acidobacteria bacterium]|nr:von Willebrand factor type A domain-containing protein [Acidobacteriota bacterium]
MLNALNSRSVLAAAGVVAAVGLTALLVTSTRNATLRPPLIVADTGVAPESVASPPGEPEAERPAPGLGGEERADAGESGSPAPPTGGVHDARSPAPEHAMPAEGEAPETVVVESDLQPPGPAPVPNRELDFHAPGATADAESFSATVAALERQREALRIQLEGLPERSDDASAVVREGEVRVRADGRVAVAYEAEAAPPRPAAVAAPLPPPVEGELARGFVSAWTVSGADPVVRLPTGACATCDSQAPRAPNTEAFANEDASPVKVTSEEPVSTFSIDVDTASYSVLRSSLTNGYLPVPESVRIEELINYFPYGYPAPGERGTPFRPTVSVSETPWNPDTLLMHIGIQGRQPATDDRPPLNLVFLVDTSGSMDVPNKLPLLVQSFRLMVGQLDPADEVAIVAYAGSAGRVLDPTLAGERGAILSALDRLHAGGSTAGAAGIQLAYRVARDMAAEGEVTRVILATDGDFNVGISDPDELEGFIARQREGGVYLSVLGFGRGNLDDATMQALAQNGNGQAAYIDTLAEAQKVLVDQLVGTLFPIADDVKIQVEFNPASVAEYRLIGYETRALRREDFNNDRVDAGEIGAGHSVTAIYEVTPVGSPAVLHDALRYAGRPADPPVADGRRGGSRELAFLRLRYKEPGEESSELIELPITRDAGGADAEQRFAAAIAGFGQLLRDGVYTGDWTWSDAIALAVANAGDDRFGYRREAVTLMRLAESLAVAE